MRVIRALLLAWTLCGSSAVAYAAVHAGAGNSPGAQDAAPRVTTAHELNRPDLESWLDGYLPYALERGDVAGAVVAVVKDGAVLLEKGYGYADVAAKTPVDPARTLMRPGSISKLFTWTAVMQQVEQGRLGLDVDINSYLDFKIPPYAGQPVTLRNLMTHTGGFEETLKYGETNIPADFLPLNRYIKVWVPERIFPPGQVPAYSNYGTALAGYIVERVSGERFEDYIDHHIFQPLRMSNSTFVQPLPARMDPQMAKGYEVASGPAKPYQLLGFTPAGGLASTGDDMAHFMIAHLQDGAYGDARILKKETAQLMHGTALTILPEVHRMLLGFYEKNRNGHRVIAHAGDLSLFHSELYLYPDDGVGVFIAMNSTGKDAAAYAIRDALFGEFTDRYFPGPTPDGQVDEKTRQRDTALISGEYRNSRRSQSNFLSVVSILGSTHVTDNGDGTISVTQADGLNDEPLRWREIAPFVWRDVNGTQRLSARVENGKVTMFSYDELSPFMVFQPVAGLESPALRLTLLKISLAVLGLTVVSWPTAALIRRRYRATLPLAGRTLQAHRGARIAALLVFVALAGWVWTFMGFINGTLPMTDGTDGWLMSLHLLTILIFVGAVLMAAWNGWCTWHSVRSFWAKSWSLFLIAASVIVLWLGCAYHLVGFGVNY
jgi:CubicO group peptidase (beta-lactamase class C family)